jgi:RNA-directed DNA polymerase
MNRFLKHWRQQGKGEEFEAKIVSYADDFVILTRRSAERRMAVQAREWTQKTMMRIGLSLNELKTTIRDALMEDFDFLGYTFGPRYWWKTGQPYIAARPSKKSIQRLTAGVRDLLRRSQSAPWPEVRDALNAKVRGWRNYFGHGSVARAYSIVNHYVEGRVRSFLRRRHLDTHVRGTRRFSEDTIFGPLGVYRCARAGNPA